MTDAAEETTRPLAAVILAAGKGTRMKSAKHKEAAEKLVSVGESERAVGLDVSEHAAWTAIMNTLLNLDETITRG